MTAALERRGLDTFVVPVERSDWLKVASAVLTLDFWKGTCRPDGPAYSWYLQKVWLRCFARSWSCYKSSVVRVRMKQKNLVRTSICCRKERAGKGLVQSQGNVCRFRQYRGEACLHALPHNPHQRFCSDHTHCCLYPLNVACAILFSALSSERAPHEGEGHGAC